MKELRKSLLAGLSGMQRSEMERASPPEGERHRKPMLAGCRPMCPAALFDNLRVTVLEGLTRPGGMLAK